jgi:hypothetical protein
MTIEADISELRTAARFSGMFNKESDYRAADELESRILSTVSALSEERDALKADKARLDWLESTLRLAALPTEVFFAGLRQGVGEAVAYQCEIAPANHEWKSHRGDTVRESIDAAREGHA